ncbi:SDR family NAD(P)-dependent oxidoreductase [Kitasatospora mediocidica]|uniref:SDR family NAD(P)-dependent oxidoreductase n=1 Tax=Kitasatospora mediocidica TaxID=58352 RepID=UPI000565A0EA|nr:glucose 1-dehydrogenase [Kitasatospora mediocidica]
MGRVDGKVAVVTGGAGGIGREICRLLLAEGALVTAVDIVDGNEADEEHAKELPHRYLRIDITDGRAVKIGLDEIARDFGSIDILVNSAGVLGPVKPSHETTEEEFDHLFAVNVRGVWLSTKYTVPHMLRSGAGSIVNMSSVNGMVGGSTIPLYHATKGAVRLMSKADAVTYARHGIRVNSVHPGSIETPMSSALSDSSSGDAVDSSRRWLEATPMGRRGSPRDVANGVLYLASDEARYVTGTELVIDGGYTAT